MIGQMVVLTSGGVLLRKWARRVAQTQYVITMGSSKLELITSLGEARHAIQMNIADIKQVRSKTIVSDGDTKRSIIEEVQIITRNGNSTVLMRGCAIDEIDWVVKCLNARLEIPVPA